MIRPAVDRLPRSNALVVALAALAVSGCGGGAAAAERPSSGNPPGPYVALAAHNIAFDTSALNVPANVAFTIVLDNQEAVPHNVSIDRVHDAARVFEGAVFSGPATRWYAVSALAPGEYAFLCQVHPSMTGRLFVRNE